MTNLEKFDTAIMILLRNSPFYGHIIMQMDRVRTSKEVTPNMAVRFRAGIPVLLWCDEFVDGLDIKHMVAVIAHEIEHVVRLHPLLSYKFIRKYPGIPANVMQLAISKALHYAMNPDIRNELRNVKVDFPDYYETEFPERAGYTHGNSAEWYFDTIMSEYKKNSSSTLAKLKNEVGDHNWKNAKITKAEDNPETQTEGVDWNGGADLNDSDIPNIKGQVEQIVKKAIDKSRGIVPGHLKEAIENLQKKPVIKWEERLRRFVMSKCGEVKRLTYMRTSKRWGDDVRGRVRSRKRFVLVAVDSSGSVSDSLLSAFINECKGMSSETTQIWVMECDATIQSMVEVDKYSRKLNQWSSYGRGGTDFEPPFRFAYGLSTSNDFASFEVMKTCMRNLKKIGSFDGIVYLTDGYAPAPNLPQRVPTIWVTVDGDPFTWGEVVHMNEEDLG